MKPFPLALTALLLAGTLLGQSIMMPIPPFSSTYSYSSAVRGFCFQTPVNFTILGLRVPDERSHGKQNVAVYQLSAKPNNTTPQKSQMLFYRTGVASSQIIPCQVSLKAGSWVGVLGACGDTSMMYNSYGTGPYNSRIAGGPQVKLERLWMNVNLISSGGIGAMTAATGSLGRVEVYVQQQDFAKAEDYGEGTTAVPVSGEAPLGMLQFYTTYNYPYTYGFYFQVPCPLTVTAWEVPDESKHGKMNVALYRLQSAPTSSVSVTPVYFKAGVPSGTPHKLQTPVSFKPGEYLGVLGACGPDSQNYLFNSYGSGGPYQAKIGSHQATLYYMRMSTSIVANQGIGTAYGYTTSTYAGRIQLYVKQFVVPAMTTTQPPVVGANAVLRMEANVKDGIAGGVFMGVGRGNLPTPLGTVLVKAPFFAIFPVPGGTGNLEVPIPNAPALLGAGPLDFQGFVLALSNFGLTNGVEWYTGK